MNVMNAVKNAEITKFGVYAVEEIEGGRRNIHCHACGRRVGAVDLEPRLDAPWLPYWWPHRVPGGNVPLSPRSELSWALALLVRAHHAEGCATEVADSRGATSARDEMIARAGRAAVEVVEAWFDGRPLS